MTDRRTLLQAVAAAGLAGATTRLWAQGAYPSRPIRVTVPWPAGGNADITIRPILEKMAQQLGQPIVVENLAGATGTVGSIQAIRLPPDGYGLLELSSSTVINLVISPNRQLDLLRDFEPIGLAASTPLVLEVHPSVPARTLAELIDYAKANPGKLSYASGGIGTSAHLLGELLKLKAGIDMTHVPYKGGAPAVQDLIGGHVQLYFDVLPTALPAARDGRVRILAITSESRSRKLPDVPTFREMGVPDIEASVWVAMMAPKGTDAAVIARLNETMNRALDDPELRQKLDTLGAEVTPGPPAALAAKIRSETQKYGDVVRRANIKAQ